MRGGCHGTDLLRNDKGAAAEGDEELTHDYVANIDVWLTEHNHKHDTKECKRHTKEQSLPLEIARVAQDKPSDETPKTGSHAVDVENVSRTYDIQAWHHLEKGREIAIPDVELDEQDGGNEGTAKDGAIREQVERDEGDWRDFPFVDDEADDCDESDDDHRDDQR